MHAIVDNSSIKLSVIKITQNPKSVGNEYIGYFLVIIFFLEFHIVETIL